MTPEELQAIRKQAKKVVRRRCVGYGEHEGVCVNDAGTLWTPYWCPQCDEQRRAHITKQLESLTRGEGR